MIRSKQTTRLLALVGMVCMLSLTACGGGGGGGDAPASGAIQVLNNTGLDLAGVAVYQGTTKVDETPGGLALGASWTFSTLAPGVYDIQAYPPGTPGSPVSAIMFYLSNTVASGQTTSLTLTP